MARNGPTQRRLRADLSAAGSRARDNHGSLANAADDGGETDELERESEAHGEAAYEEEAASSDCAHDAD
jgi:hypothetical protein